MEITKEELIKMLENQGIMTTAKNLDICFRTLQRNCKEAGIDLKKYKKKSGPKKKFIIK